MTPEILRKLYLDDQLSIKGVAERLNTTPKIVSNRLKKYNIPLRNKKELSELSGKRFENLVVQKLSHIKNNRSYWKCKCDCGKEKIVVGTVLTGNQIVSCGCHSRNNAAKQLEDFTNKKFGKLTVQHRVENNKNNQTQWYCKCDCGGHIIYPAFYLKRNKYPKCKGCKYSLGQKTKSAGHGDISLSYFRRLKEGAFTRNLSFLITIEYIWDVFISQNKRCALSGREIEFVRNFNACSSQQTASVDRIDSTKGYIKGNIQIVHKEINHLKNKCQNDHFIEICKQVAEYQNVKHPQ